MGRGASPLPDCTLLTSAILMQFKKKYIFEHWSEELIGGQSPTEPKLSVSGHRDLLFQLFFRCMQYLDKKFCLFASSNTECRRMRIYLKIHFTEKRWLLKEVEHQTECVLTPFLALWRGISAKWTRRLPLGILICPTHRTNDEICVLRHTVRERKPLCRAYTHCFGLLHGGKLLSCICTNEQKIAKTQAHAPHWCWAHLPPKRIFTCTAISDLIAPTARDAELGRFS